ncbi:hypothetical protein CMV_017848 [Castanea mollissima]|uniref:Uncharacterized protein n=1 Tax=Castanea mollissima TaxID=60419 RepID=A0A8J4VQ52_9ROSI|nr:hypothetical protein CMV_017848 [Castanea mollissima]
MVSSANIVIIFENLENWKSKKLADDAAVEVSIPERTTIPSGDDSVWADVSPLLESACKDTSKNLEAHFEECYHSSKEVLHGSHTRSMSICAPSNSGIIRSSIDRFISFQPSKSICRQGDESSMTGENKDKYLFGGIDQQSTQGKVCVVDSYYCPQSIR